MADDAPRRSGRYAKSRAHLGDPHDASAPAPTDHNYYVVQVALNQHSHAIGFALTSMVHNWGGQVYPVLPSITQVVNEHIAGYLMPPLSSAADDHVLPPKPSASGSPSPELGEGSKFASLAHDRHDAR